MPDETNELANKTLVQQEMSFLSRALDKVPNFVMGLIGTFVSSAVAIVIVLQFGGVQSIAIRVANAYADSLEAQMKSVSAETAKLASIAKTLEGVLTRLESAEARMNGVEKLAAGVADHMTSVETTVVDLRRRMDDVDRAGKIQAQRIEEVAAKSDRLGRWACDHIDAVKTRPSAPDCPPK